MTTTSRPRGVARALVIGAAVISGAVACVGTHSTAGTPRYLFPVREYTYPSGLRVVIEQDDAAGIAGAVLVVEAGHVDDPSGKDGLAHTFEHLVVSAPTDAGTSLWKILPRLGAGSFNAMTGMEQTTYFAFVPRASLDDLVAALLARMADPARGIDDAVLASELPVVAEELRSRQELTARMRALASVLPAGDPYVRVFAREDRPSALTLADVRSFAEHLYRPERMTLVLAGAIGPDWDKRLQTLLPLQLGGKGSERRPPVRRSGPVAGPIAAATSDNRIQAVKTSVAGPELWMAWPLPPARGVERFELVVMARVADRVLTESLDRSPSGVLGVEISLQTESQASAFICRVRLRSAADADRARKDIGTVLSSLTELNLPLARSRIVRGYRHAALEAGLQTVLAMESLETRARVRAAIVHHAAGAQISEVLAIIQKVSPDAAATFAGRYFKPDAARSVLLLPDDAHAGDHAVARGRLRTATLPADAADGSMQEIDGDSEDDGAGGPALAAAAASIPGSSRARVTTLANGLTVIALRRPGLPVASMLLGFHGEPQPGEVPGVRAAIPLTPLWNLTPEPIERGIFHQTTMQPDSYLEKMSFFSGDTHKALDLIGEQPARLEVQWPSARFQRWIDAEGQYKSSPATRASNAFRRALFPDHAYWRTSPFDAVRSVTGANIEAWLRHTRRPNNGALIVVGDVDVDEVSRDAERLLRDWEGEETPVPAPPIPPVIDGRRGPSPRILFTKDESRRSAEIRFGCLLPPVRTLQQDVTTDVLARLIRDDLRRGLRFRLGASYAPNVAARTLRGGTTWIEGTLDLADTALPDGLDLLRNWLDRDRPNPVHGADLERVRAHQARESALRDSTNARVAYSLFSAWNMGWPPAVLDDYPAAITHLTIGDIDTDLDACRSSAVISVLGAGPFPAH